VIVLDASAALDLLLHTEGSDRIRARLARDGWGLCAPHLLDLEVAQALRRRVRTGTLREVRARGALEDLEDFAVRRVPHDVLLRRIWSLRDNATAYDAAYLALAEAYDAKLITRDARLAAVPGFEDRVEVF
jgi:predicted nucleic acid-binding protein